MSINLVLFIPEILIFKLGFLISLVMVVKIPGLDLTLNFVRFVVCFSKSYSLIKPIK